MIREIKSRGRPRANKHDGHTTADKLPRRPQNGGAYWLNSPISRNRYTHSLFKFPAKFHAPIVRWALGTFGRRGSFVLDPFTGSGTVHVEALLRGINSIGVDIDPLACLVAKVKSTPLNPEDLTKSFSRIKNILSPFVRVHEEQEGIAGADITVGQYELESAHVTIPSLPNITHWFRRYVIIDLARIIRSIEDAGLNELELNFFRACTAAIIRRVSNADPDPVSGLEVTRIQAEKNNKRTIKVFDEFFRKIQREISSMSTLWNDMNKLNNSSEVLTHVLNCDVLEIEQTLLKLFNKKQEIPLIMTSPPYCRSVEYSRRHRLELFWLGLVDNADEHIDLTHSYIGRKYVRVNDWTAEEEFGYKALDRIINRISERNPHTGRTVHHYFYSMREVFHSVKNIMTRRGTMVCVVGDSVCCGIPVATSDFIADLSMDYFILQNRFSYAIQNHHMQYGLWNGDGIREEHVLVLKPR